MIDDRDTGRAPEPAAAHEDVPARSRGAEVASERSPLTSEESVGVWKGLYALSLAAKKTLPADDAILVGIAVGATVAMSDVGRAKGVISVILAAARVTGADPVVISETIVSFASAILGDGTMKEAGR